MFFFQFSLSYRVKWMSKITICTEYWIHDLMFVEISTEYRGISIWRNHSRLFPVILDWMSLNLRNLIFFNVMNLNRQFLLIVFWRIIFLSAYSYRYCEFWKNVHGTRYSNFLCWSVLKKIKDILFHTKTIERII